MWCAKCGDWPIGSDARAARHACCGCASPIPGEERAVVEEFNAARDAEYAEVLERIPALRQELAQERARGRATYAEVEESEADLDRFRSLAGQDRRPRLLRRSRRPGSPRRRRRVGRRSGGIREAALRAEAPEAAPHGTPPRLRAVEPS